MQLESLMEQNRQAAQEIRAEFTEVKEKIQGIQTKLLNENQPETENLATLKRLQAQCEELSARLQPLLKRINQVDVILANQRKELQQARRDGGN